MLRFQDGTTEQAIKLAVRQSRLYCIAVQTRLQSQLAAERDAILSSFEAYPVSSMRGGLLSSDAPPTLRTPPVPVLRL